MQRRAATAAPAIIADIVFKLPKYFDIMAIAMELNQKKGLTISCETFARLRGSVYEIAKPTTSGSITSSSTALVFGIHIII